MDGWTVHEAARLLDPPMTVDEIRALVIAARIAPLGRRRPAPGSAGGRPAPVYDPAELMAAHAGIVPLLVRAEVWCQTDQ